MHDPSLCVDARPAGPPELQFNKTKVISELTFFPFYYNTIIGLLHTYLFV